jgi:protein-S-isoprenylcysteine O-methyltransferase Ste14
MTIHNVINWAWIITLAVWLAGSFFNKRTVRRQSSGSRLLQMGLGAAAGLLIWGPGSMRSWPTVVPHSAEMAMAALVLTLMGLALALWSRFALGRNWSATVSVKHGHNLVRHGPYAIVRHPIYSGFLLALLGTAIARGTMGAFLGVLMVLLLFRLKLQMEEQFMLEQFGAEYEVYRSEVKGLIPFVW